MVDRIRQLHAHATTNGSSSPTTRQSPRRHSTKHGQDWWDTQLSKGKFKGVQQRAADRLARRLSNEEKAVCG
jgi:hypothetical protein